MFWKRKKREGRLAASDTEAFAVDAAILPARMLICPRAKEARALEHDLADIAQRLLDSDGADTEPLRNELRERVEAAAAWQQEQVDTLLSEMEAALLEATRSFRKSVDGNESVLDGMVRLQGGLGKAAGVDSIEDARRILREEMRRLQGVVHDQAERQEQLREDLRRLAARLEQKIEHGKTLARTDGKTRIGNRAALGFYLEAILGKLRLGGGPYTMACLEVEELPDAAVAAFAERVRDAMGHKGLLCRLAPNRFVAVFHGWPIVVEARVKRLQKSLARRPLKISEGLGESIVELGLRTRLVTLGPADEADLLTALAERGLGRPNPDRHAA